MELTDHDTLPAPVASPEVTMLALSELGVLGAVRYTTATDGLDAVPSPIAFRACTVNVYDAPSVSGLNVVLVAVAETTMERTNDPLL